MYKTFKQTFFLVLVSFNLNLLAAHDASSKGLVEFPGYRREFSSPVPPADVYSGNNPFLDPACLAYVCSPSYQDALKTASLKVATQAPSADKGA